MLLPSSSATPLMLMDSGTNGILLLGWKCGLLRDEMLADCSSELRPEVSGDDRTLTDGERDGVETTELREDRPEGGVVNAESDEEPKR